MEPRSFLSGFFMLVARRDPPFDGGADDAGPNHFPSPRASGFTRFMTAIQLFGSLLAVPVGIASAYSFYRANFSPDTTCQTLRSGIISLLDKSVDASTRRILVRRDVEAFEKTCAAVDPDATAAFKALLAADKPTATAKAAVPATGSVTPSTEERAKETVRKIEPKPQVAAKQSAPATPTTEPVRREPAVSDAQWLDAVRQALVTHKPEDRPVEAAKPQTVTTPAARPTQEAALPSPSATPAPTPNAVHAVPAPVPSVPVSAPLAAPALPPPVSIAPPPTQRVDADHPVPPGSIPDGLPVAETPKPQETTSPQEHDRSRISKWISAIPLLGPAVDNARR